MLLEIIDSAIFYELYIIGIQNKADILNCILFTSFKFSINCDDTSFSYNDDFVVMLYAMELNTVKRTNEIRLESLF